ncbi:MAG: hypothetical protein M1829_006354 [Trizodia sp. TS-e1964]|nr:MAG: hypothetical protein M1829_006354 [Trizodia sp. TS-e1964]
MLFNAITAAAVLLLPQAFASPAQVRDLVPRDLVCNNGFCSSVSKRAVCNADNALRDLRNPRNSVDASAFCSSYIRPTVTVVNSLTVTTSTQVVTTIPVTTVIVPNSVVPKQRRDSVLPSYVATYPTSRISSACSCFISAAGLTTTYTTTTTTVPVTATTTTTGPVSTVTVTSDCGLVGCYNGSGLIVDTVDNITTTAALCEAKCAATTGCLSFQFGQNSPTDTNRVCNLFNVPVGQNYAGFDPSNTYCNQFTLYSVTCPL